MSTNWVRTAVLSALACFVPLVGCDDNPVNENRDNTAGLQVNPTFAVVDAGDTARVTAVAVNRYGEETRTAVSFAACDNTISVAIDPERVNLEAPDRAIVVGNTLGPSCVTVSGGGFSDSVGVAVVAAGLAVTSAPTVLRAGETGEVVVTTVNTAGAAVGPFARTDVTYSSDDDAVVAVTDDMGSISTSESGAANITATWTGEAGVTRQVTHGIGVVANVPVGAAFESSSFGALAAGDSAKLEVVVSDALGNQNTDENEILGVAAVSSDPGAATVRADLVPSSSVNVIVTVFGEGSGAANITGTVTTSEGPFAFGPADVTVLNPIIGSVTPASGPFGSPATLGGTGLSAAGFDTEVRVNDLLLGDFDVVSAGQIDVTMPVFLAAGDYDVVVSVGGVPSATATWTQVGEFDSDVTEPANDDPATPSPIAAPFEFVGSFSGGDIDDIFQFTLSADATLDIRLDWPADKDLDFFVTLPDGSAADGASDGAGCEGFFNHPETGECALSAGTYLIWVEDFDALDSGDFTAVDYTIRAVVQE